MIHVYRLLYQLLQFILLVSKPLLSAKAKTYIQLRKNQKYLSLRTKNPLWFHASSGEIEYCKSIITSLKKKHPEYQIVVSYSSASAEKLLFNIQNETDLIFPLPWDSKDAVRKLIDHIQPSAVIFARTDFWPELIHQLSIKNIPLIAISMFPRFNFINNFIYKWLLQKFSLVTTVDINLSKNLEKIILQPVQTTPDSRFDQVFNRLKADPRITITSTTKKIVFGSTWPEDEIHILPTIPSLIELGYQIIICPHEVSRASEIKQRLKLENVLLLSETLNPNSLPLNISTDFEILIIDQVGLLADIYRYTDFAFVGGSFKQRVHSVMEPLCANNIVLFGPCIQNNPEALSSKEQKIAFQIHTAQNIIDLIKNMNQQSLANTKLKIQSYTNAQRGSTELITKEIISVLKDKK